MPATIFTVKNEHLERLSAAEAVLFFANLLRAEVRRLGTTCDIRQYLQSH